MPDTPGTLKYPALLDSQDSLIRFLDNATTILEDPAVNETDSVFNADTSSFPATGVFVIEGENVVYTGKTGTSFTGCLRGQFTSLGGLPAAKHPAGVVIEQLNTAALRDMLVQGLLALETKLGSGADVPANGDLLMGTGAGTSAWSAPTTVSLVTGPSASTNGELPLFNGTTGKVLKRSNTMSGFLQLSAGVASAAALTLAQITTALGFTPANKAGDTFSGNLDISKSDALLRLISTNAGNSQLNVYDTTDGGVTLYNQNGDGFLAKIDASGIWVSNILKLTTVGLGILGDTPTVPLEFPNAVGCKIALYGGNGQLTSYGIGVESNELRLAGGGSLGVTLYSGGYSGAKELQANSAGVTISSLAGTGSRILEADANGLLSATKVNTLDKLYSNSFSNVTNASLPNNTFSNTYARYLIKLSNVALNTAAQGLWWRGRVAGVDDSGASTYRSSGHVVSEVSSSIPYGYALTLGVILPALTGGTIGSTTVTMWVENPANASLLTSIMAQYAGVWNGVAWETGWSNGMYNAARAHDSMTFWSGAGNITSMTVEVWGMKS